MKGHETFLASYLNGTDKRFIIPLYQRNYDWKIENCAQLYDDLIDIIRFQRKSHFFGSIVSITDESTYASECLIIDGQQRLTTVSLLMLAIANLLDSEKVTANDIQLSKRLKETYLINPYQPGEKKIKLKPVKDDQFAFNRLFIEKGVSDLVRTSNVTRNYSFFYNKILEQNADVEALVEAIQRLVVISISLDPSNDDPQLIFESLNSTGLELSEGDKIRNFILMKLDLHTQEQYYELYWNKIEKLTWGYVSDFIKDYLTVKMRSIPVIARVYIVFKNYAKESGQSIDDILRDMLKFAQYYHDAGLAIVKNASNSEAYATAANKVLTRINRMGMSVLNPFKLNLLDYYYSTDKITPSELAEIFAVIESYLFRRTVCGVPANSLSKTFATLHSDVLQNMKESDSYRDVLTYLMLHKTGSARFPNDEEFLLALREKNFYALQTKSKSYLFERLENGDSLDAQGFYDMIENGTWTIEHIMPQTLTDEWKTALGDDWEKIHATWLHRLGNLTITSYNGKYSNESFSRKLNMKNGLKDSRFAKLNSDITTCDKWGLDELATRAKSLESQSLKLWPHPTSAFQPKSAVSDTHFLGDDFDFTSTTIRSYTFYGNTTPVSAWAEMFEGILRSLFELDSTIIYQLVEQNEWPGSYFSDKEFDRPTFIKLGEGAYARTASSTSEKIRVLIDLFRIFRINLVDLAFNLGE